MAGYRNTVWTRLAFKTVQRLKKIGLTSASPHYLSWKPQWSHLQQHHKSESFDRGDMTWLSSHLQLQNNAQRFLANPLVKSAVECRKQNVPVTSVLLCYCKRMTEIDSRGRKKKETDSVKEGNILTSLALSRWFFLMLFSFWHGYESLQAFIPSGLSIPAYPLPSMSTLPETDWPNICRPGFIRRPDSFCNRWYQPSDNTCDHHEKKENTAWLVFAFCLLFIKG